MLLYTVNPQIIFLPQINVVGMRWHNARYHQRRPSREFSDLDNGMPHNVEKERTGLGKRLNRHMSTGGLRKVSGRH
jgi:hypothetical protein